MIYQATGENWVYLLDTQSRIPFAPDNPDYQAYLQWLSEGNTPLPPSESQLAEVRSHCVCTMRQARLALHQAGLLSLIDATIAAMDEPDRTNAQIEWEYATEVKRNWPWVISLGTALGLSESQIDDLFALASTL
jgi:hypothetical protein